MRIVIRDGYTENPGDLSWGELEKPGKVAVYGRMPADKIVERARDAEAVYTNKLPVSGETLDACPNLKFIGALAAGYDAMDYKYARQNGIPVANVPAYGTAAADVLPANCIGTFM